jgi:hypothetical protein
MLEVPFLDEIVMEKARETAQRYIVAFLEARFGDVPWDLIEQIEAMDDEKQLTGFVRSAGSCLDLEAFRKAITRR